MPCCAVCHYADSRGKGQKLRAISHLVNRAVVAGSGMACPGTAPRLQPSVYRLGMEAGPRAVCPRASVPAPGLLCSRPRKRTPGHPPWARTQRPWPVHIPLGLAPGTPRTRLQGRSDPQVAFCSRRGHFFGFRVPGVGAAGTHRQGGPMCHSEDAHPGCLRFGTPGTASNRWFGARGPIRPPRVQAPGPYFAPFRKNHAQVQVPGVPHALFQARRPAPGQVWDSFEPAGYFAWGAGVGWVTTATHRWAVF